MFHCNILSAVEKTQVVTFNHLEGVGQTSLTSKMKQIQKFHCL